MRLLIKYIKYRCITQKLGNIQHNASELSQPLKGSWLWTLLIVKVLFKTTTFRKLDLFTCSGRNKVAPTLLGPYRE
jgi:hypothetical protein